MPGKPIRSKSVPLTRQQSEIAQTILLKYFNYNMEENQLNNNARIIVKEINREFINNSYSPIYIKRKMTDWVSNRLYRLRKSGFIKIKTKKIKTEKIKIKKIKTKKIKTKKIKTPELEVFFILDTEMMHYLPTLYNY